MISTFMNSRKEKIWQAARDGDKFTLTRLLLLATDEDLQFEVKVIHVTQLCVSGCQKCTFHVISFLIII